MKCPECQAENPDEQRFCAQCGSKIERSCTRCGSTNPPQYRFCGNCGHSFDTAAPTKPQVFKTSSYVESERKHVTVLFSDLCGYTSMTEKLDPEEVKEIMSRIFGEIAQVITKYEGFIERFVGDAVMAIFGVPKAHEDDPVRAVMSAIEIHKLVNQMSPKVKTRTGVSLAMHSGINTGLVVTGEIQLDQGTHGLTGDVINTAARLQSLAKEDEILVGYGTYRQSEGYFNYESLEATKLKGKEKPVFVYRVISPKDKPSTIHRLTGVRSVLIGRKSEMAQLREALQKLKEGKGSIFLICGDAGTGKSRLVEEFKKTLNLAEIQWHEAHAFAYSQNTPYFPLIDLLNRLFDIKEGDSPEETGRKIETNVNTLIGAQKDITPFVCSLYSLKDNQVGQVNPEKWKEHLQQAVRMIFSALSQKYPAVICLEDLHWADPSFLDLLRFLLLNATYPVLFLCIYRTPFSLFTTAQLTVLGNSCHEIRIADLSPSETQCMVESLLHTESVPFELQQFLQGKAGGNPFYLEELINSLIESEILTRDEKGWRLSRKLHDSDMPSTINGVITARFDRLEKETRRILREASVIGRAFLYEILKRITQFTSQIDQCLEVLEQLDIIRPISFQPELEYIFKHALIHEVIYNGLLLKERRAIHERIGLVIEKAFAMRLSEFYENLAYHFERGESRQKAIDYLIKSGEKCLNRYAVHESDQYFKRGFQRITEKETRSREEDTRLIDLLIKWAFVFHYRGDFKGLKEILTSHENVAKRLNDKARLGMLYTQLGLAHYQTENIKEAYDCLQNAMTLGEETKDNKVIGYACSHLSWVCPELGLIDDSLKFGKRGIEVSELLENDEFLYFNSLGGMGLAYYYRGERTKVYEVGEALLAFARKRTNIRSRVLGYFFLGCSHIVAGDFSSAINCLKDAISSSADPWFSQFPRLLLGFCYISTGQHEQAENAIQEIFDYSSKFGTDTIKTPARILEGVVTITKGDLSKGLKMLETVQQDHLRNNRSYVYATAEDIIGRIYLQIVEGSHIKFSLLKNIGFLIRSVPSASREAEKHFNNAIRVSEQIGAKGTLGNAYFNLGLLYKARGIKHEAKTNISKAITCFEKCEAEAYLKGAREALETII